MRISELRVTSPDGAVIAARRSGSGPTLLLVHGTTADGSRWSGVAPLLEPHFTVIAMDRRGRGGSTDGAAYSIAAEASDIVALAGCIGEPIHLLGHSYGAICCLEAAPRLADLRSLVLYEPPLPVGPAIVPPETRAELDRLAAAGDDEHVLLAFFRGVVRMPEHQLDVVRASPAWQARLHAAHTVAREIRMESEYRPDLERLAAIRCPVLLLLGGDSPAYFRAATAAIHRSIPGSRVHEMPGQQHVAMDMVPTEFVRLVTSFLLGA